MGFFFTETEEKRAKLEAREKRAGVAPPHRSKGKRGTQQSLLAQLGCNGCPLNSVACNSPKMPPQGDKGAEVLFLVEPVTKQQDDDGNQWAGGFGRMIEACIPDGVGVRWANTVRCLSREAPDKLTIACCRPLQVAEIERTKPVLIIGVGTAALQWTIGESSTTTWRRHIVPVRIGNHSCWFSSVMDPYWVQSEQRGQMKSEWVKTFAQDLEFLFSSLPSLRKNPPILESPEDYYRGIVTCKPGDFNTARKWLKEIQGWEECAVDIETNGLRPYGKDPKILSVSFSNYDTTYCIGIDHPEAKFDAGQRKELLASLRKALTKIRWAQGTKFEQEWFGFFFGDSVAYDVDWHDTQAQNYVLYGRQEDKSRGGASNLNGLTKQHLGFGVKDLSDLNMNALANEPLEKVLIYNGLDAKYTYVIGQLQWELLEGQGLTAVYDATRRRGATLSVMQRRGVVPNFPKIETFHKEMSEEVKGILERMWKDKDVRSFERQGHAFEPTSNPVLLSFFRDFLKRKEVNVGKRGQVKYSADEEVLKKINHPVASMVLELRSVSKLLSTYILPLMRGGKNVWEDELIHTIFNHLLTATTRLSSEDPNLQNFPKRQRKDIRIVIRAPAGYWIVSIDFGQIEARVIGMASKDPVFCDMLWHNYDVHMEWAEKIAHVFPDRVGGKKMLSDKGAMKTFRSDVKNQWTFPLFFGSVLPSVARNLGVDERKLTPLFDEFWETFDGVLKWQKRLLAKYEKTGYVELLNGARRYGPLSYNEIINTPIQGTASAIVTDAMCDLGEMAYKEDRFDLCPRINVHDDLTFYFPDAKMDEYIDVASRVMTKPRFDYINVPLTAEIAVGRNWYEQEEIATVSSEDFGFKRLSPKRKG